MTLLAAAQSTPHGACVKKRHRGLAPLTRADLARDDAAMARYSVSVAKAPKGHSVPPLLQEFGAWLKTQPHGAVGWFDALTTESIPKQWSAKNAARLQKSGFAFLSLPDGSLLSLLAPGEKAPPAVVLLGSEGESRTVAPTLEAFLHLLAKGATEIDELDDADASKGRPALRAWLKVKGVKVPKAKSFDFNAWLAEEGSEAPAKKPAPAKASPARRPTKEAAKLGPKLRKLASVMGLRADDPALVAYVTRDLGKKPPVSTSAREEDAYVVPHASKGIELLFSHNVLNDAYPPIPKGGRAFVPYLSLAWIKEPLGEPPFPGVTWTSDEAALTKVLGKPTLSPDRLSSRKGAMTAEWRIPLDEAAGVDLWLRWERGGLEVTMQVASGRALSEHGVPADHVVGIFVAWAIARDLLDPSRFADHAPLVAAIKARKERGSALVAAALPRGLWDTHFRDRPGLADKLYSWFHRLGGGYIVTDLCKAFGKRKGPHGHDEPKIDSDAWDVVDKASKVFDAQFAAWLK